MRQRPPTAKRFIFLTLEDEWGLINVIARPDVFEAQRATSSTGVVLLVQGRLERASGHTGLLASRAWKVCQTRKGVIVGYRSSFRTS